MLGTVGNPVLSRYHNLTPAFTATGFNFVKSANKEGTLYEPLPYAIHFCYGISLAPVYDMEFAFPFSLTGDDHYFDTVLAAMHYVVDKSKEYAQGKSMLFVHNCLILFAFNISGILGFGQDFSFSTTMELRVIAKSDCLLCPATRHPRDDAPVTAHTAYLEILSFAGSENYQKFFKEVGEKWMKLGGVPHWFKQWTFLDNIVDHTRDNYKDNLVKFRTVFDSINNDNGSLCKMFVNSTMEKILGLD